MNSQVKVMLEKLNSEQIAPVLETDGAVLVLAGAGSGKTRVLTSRIAYLVLEKGVSPNEIMAITFTNKAAKEMKERLCSLVGELDDMWVSTIHSMCVKILRYDCEKLGFSRNFTIYDEQDKEKALKRVFEDLGMESDKFFKNFKNLISSAKNDCMSPAEFKIENAGMRFIDEFTRVYEKYDEQLYSNNAMDFDDLLYKTYRLFCERPDVAEKYANRFRYIHIDEFQDTNKVQFNIAKRLALKHGNLFVVGDDDQSIYSWRGAKIENILGFDRYFSNAKVYKLERNYRSTKNILTLANEIIANNNGRRQKVLWTENSDGARVETFVGGDELSEASFVATQIKSLMSRTDFKYSDFAVFMRVNALSRAFEQEFMKYGVPYRVYGGFRFFERKEIKDVLAYLKLIANPNDNEAFLRAIMTPRRGIGEKTLNELREYAYSLRLSLFESLESIDFSTLSNSAKGKLIAFKELIDGFRSLAEEKTTDVVLKEVMDKTDFLSQFAEKSEENSDKIMNLSELQASAEQFVKDNPNTQVSDYLNSVTLSSDVDDINTDDAVTVATIHASKGLEYKCVFVAGLDEKILPITQNFDDEDEIEEERRLMYVAITRAKERLYLTRAQSRYMYGRREFMTQSRFLKEAKSVIAPLKTNQYSTNTDYDYKRSFRYGGESDEISMNSTSNSGGYSSTYAKSMLSSTVPKENKKVNYNGFTSGVKVKHQKFGEGVVTSVSGSGEQTVVSVLFKGVGMKTLSAKFAPMEILK